MLFQTCTKLMVGLSDVFILIIIARNRINSIRLLLFCDRILQFGKLNQYNLNLSVSCLETQMHFWQLKISKIIFYWMKLKVSSSELHDLYLLEKPQDYFFPQRCSINDEFSHLSLYKIIELNKLANEFLRVNNQVFHQIENNHQPYITSELMAEVMIL